MSTSATPLSFHFKQKHFWFDIVVLLVLWILVFTTPQTYHFYTELPFGFLLKIIALVASLEFISFLSFHFFGTKSSLLLQGLLGGFISSTTVFVQLNYDNNFKYTNENILSIALLMAICSMLIECLLILATIPSDFKTIYFLPFGIMLFLLICSIIFLYFTNKSTYIPQSEIVDLKIEDPITWKKVLLFSGYIVLLKYILIILKKFADIPFIVGSFLASLFEAHAVLAVNATNFTKYTSVEDINSILLVILIGSLVSKIFFVLRGEVLDKKRLVILPILISLSITIAVTLIMVI